MYRLLQTVEVLWRQGDVIASVMPDNGYGYREVIAYVTDQVARSLSVGMKTQISPSFAAREEYGYMTGSYYRNL